MIPITFDWGVFFAVLTVGAATGFVFVVSYVLQSILCIDPGLGDYR